MADVMPHAIPHSTRAREQERPPAPREITFHPVQLRHQRAIQKKRTVTVVAALAEDLGADRIERPLGPLLKRGKGREAPLVATRQNDARRSVGWRGGNEIGGGHRRRTRACPAL